MKRRHFFKSIGAAGGLFLSSAAPVSAFSTVSSFKKAFTGMPRDEEFWKKLRKQFLIPADYAYLNTGGLGSSPFMVIKTVKKMMDEEDSHPNPGRCKKDWWKIKEKFAALLGPGVKKEDLALTGTATESINIILNGLPLKRGDEVITSTHEHVALHVPLLNKMKTEGIVIKTFEPDIIDTMGNVRQIEKLMSKHTRLIFTSHITCTTGQILPVKEIGQLAKSSGVWYALDGVQVVGHMPINLRDTGVDFYAFSGHKWLLGPKRTGILYVREDLLDTLKPTVVGAYSSDSSDMEKRQLVLHPTAQRYEYGTQNDALFYGLGEAVDFIRFIGMQTIWKHNKHLSEMFYKGLQEIPGLELLSPAGKNNRSAMISFKLNDKNKNVIRICVDLEGKRLRVRHVNEANLDGIRASFHIYNNEEEVERLLGEIKKIAAAK
ncbi:MAG: aminotransferase class V-fold PLP-dependent enzyme [Candidatus Aminicenantes bacterium]|nr:aminotransferase class V-fold PLP-dependent enzyme [Candidatus Aminicenantes bacterium]NIM78071.1 aminotransferase class V-fold PLP-dependent enzyme [Candidatus Aminicenantes bacterium]NIN17391.1 aminotransferase class V-fold PLP-dependent enzyme [Candidatus Aminicenantes bacterium]NIN41284.1 aminotransferase class V-fold PLP-dependent enzyme [Candidatus Aminicenantes bacterium]NIN84057.1 aminotransferase class V-fold PLP-dependent enzyme [Candidatus Aminicenantes bacterium]